MYIFSDAQQNFGARKYLHYSEKEKRLKALGRIFMPKLISVVGCTALAASEQYKSIVN